MHPPRCSERVWRIPPTVTRHGTVFSDLGEVCAEVHSIVYPGKYRHRFPAGVGQGVNLEDVLVYGKAAKPDTAAIICGET